MYDKFTLDGNEYDVRVIYGSIQRTFAIEEGVNVGKAIDKTRIRDIVGTSYSYQMQIEGNPNNPDDYYDFYQAISEPTDTHYVSFPYNNETLEFECCVEGGTDVDMGWLGGKRKWSALTLIFTPYTPQRKQV